MALRVERAILNIQPPEWLAQEAQNRIVLFLNHVLKQEPLARERLRRQCGKSVEIRWNHVQFRVSFSAAGLIQLDMVQSSSTGVADLLLHINEPSGLQIVQQLLEGEKPPIRIEGDVQLAAEVNWLIDHVRWDVEADLSRILGDELARLSVQLGSQCAAALKDFARTIRDGIRSFTPSAKNMNAS